MANKAREVRADEGGNQGKVGGLFESSGLG